MRKERSFLPLAAPFALLVAGCGAGGNTAPALQHIVPAQAYSDTPTAIQLLGGPFHPPVEIDTYSGTAGVAPDPFQISLDPLRPVIGRRSVAAIDPMWRDEGRIDAMLAAGLLAGNYTIEMRDAAGHTIPSTATFTSLGPDIDPPHIVFLEPPAGSTFAPGDVVSVAVRVDDGAGQVAAAQSSASSLALAGPLPARDCPLDGEGVCQFFVPTKAGPHVLEPIDIEVDAQDSMQNSASAYLRINVAWAPAITTVTPPEGTTAGGTPITVAGQSFIPDISQITVDGVPIDSTVDSDGTSIHGFTMTHIPGGAKIAVNSAESLSNIIAFNFIAPPILKLINPTDAEPTLPTLIDISGNNFRDQTQFSWTQGTDPPHPISYAPATDPAPALPYERLINENHVTLSLLPGTGTITICAHDPISGNAQICDAFTFDSPP